MRNSALKIFVITVDLTLAVASYFIAFLARFSGNLPEYNFAPFISALPLVALSFMAYADVFGLLKFLNATRSHIVASIFKLVFMQALTTTSITYFLQGFSFPRTVLLIAAAIQAALLCAWNLLTLWYRDRFTEPASAMIIGGAKNTGIITGKLAGITRTHKIKIDYIFAPEDKADYFNVISDSAVEEVYLCSGLSEDLRIEILLHCMNHRIIVCLVPEVFEIAMINAGVLHIDDTPLILLDRPSLSFEQRFFKRAFDLTATIAALPLLLPFLCAFAIGVKLTSPGKIFYSQDRVTGGGKIYKIYKFRTMYEDAELLTGPVISSENDKRVTPFGKVLRRCHIDEFPQLFNVLKGEMSLVGPRSERPYFVERFNRDIAGYNIRNNVKAGLTGYAQIFGNYETEAEYKLKYDILYIKNYSMLLDIKLIFQTFNAILANLRRKQ